MTPINIAYLFMVLAAFAAFIGVLGFTSTSGRLADRRTARERRSAENDDR